jgi:hypothetical protein
VAAPFLDVAVNRPDAPPNPHAAPLATPAPGPAPAVLDVEGVSVESDASTPPSAAAPAEPEPRQGRGRRSRKSATATDGLTVLSSDEVEALATAAQAVADAADSFVQRCNAVLRARGVRV